MIKQREITTKSPKQTQKFAANLAKKLKGGEILALIGELGSGKTTFVQGLALGLGIKKRILSPTFIFIREYSIPKKVIRYPLSVIRFFHVDLYRLQSQGTEELQRKEIRNLGLEEIWGKSENIVAIEWAEKIEKILPPNTIKIYFDHINPTVRRIKIHPKSVITRSKSATI